MTAIMDRVQVLLASTGAWHLGNTAKAFEARGALAELWLADKNPPGVPSARYQRCWPFHLAMKPLYELAPNYYWEKAFYNLVPIWDYWVRRQLLPDCTVVQAIMGLGTALFDTAATTRRLQVVDCPNTHPTTYYGYWQRECDLWCPGEQVIVPRWIFARMNRELERADLIVVQSKFARESMISNGITESKVFVNPMGVDTTLFRKRTEIPAAPRFICVGGAITLRKGHQYLFRAFEMVRQALPNAELVCVGKYKYDFRLERPKWEGKFIHYEGLTQAQVAELLQTSTAFVFPSQEEGIARAQIEALAAGLPVVGTHEGGATTVIENGVEGFIVNGHNPEEIAEAMIKLATDKELNRQMGEAAYRKAATFNSWQDYGDRLLAEYKRRLAERS